MDLLQKLFGPPIPTVTPAEAQALLKGANPPFIIDVREPDEFAGGHVAGARLIPLRELERRQKELPRGRTILCVCASGSRSASAARYLAQAGHEVLNLRGGMGAWQRARLPVKTR